MHIAQQLSFSHILLENGIDIWIKFHLIQF